MVFNTVNGGFLGQKLKNEHHENIKKRKPNVLKEPPTQGEIDQMKEDFENLKSIVVCEEEMENIKQKLVSTMQYRVDLMMSDKRLDIREAFPYILVESKLVSYIISFFTKLIFKTFKFVSILFCRLCSNLKNVFQRPEVTLSLKIGQQYRNA